MGRKSRRARAPKLSATPFDDPFEGPLHELHDLDRERAHGAAEAGGLGDDVVGVARVQPGDGDDRGLGRRDVAGHHRLDRAHQVRGDDDRVDARLGAGAVRADALDVDVEERAARHHRPRAHRELADVELRPVVDAEDRVARELLEEPVLDHRLRAAEPLLGGLEDEEHLPLEVAGLGEVAGRPEEHRGVPVVPAGVHPPIVPGAVLEPRRLLDGKRVHVCPQPHRAGRVAGPERPHDAGPPDAPVDLAPELLEALRDEIRGPVLLESELGVGVDVAPPGGHLVVERADAIDCGHVQVSSFASRDSSSCRCTLPEALRGKSSKSRKRIPFGCL